MSKSHERQQQEVKKELGKEPGFLDKPMTRRDFLKVSAAIGVTYAAGKGLMLGTEDYKKFKAEELSQFGESPVVRAAVELLGRLDIKVPKDELYGFVYPTTGEMAAKYREALSKKVSSPQVPSLITIQEKEPKSAIGSFKYRDRGITAPRVSRSNSPDEPSYFRLPSYMEEYSVNHAASTLYHEGLHLFFEHSVDNVGAPEEVFHSENVANIGDVLLSDLLHSTSDPIGDVQAAPKAVYYEALKRGDKSIWETYLKKLYKLP